jgi:hypothetical protein
MGFEMWETRPSIFAVAQKVWDAGWAQGITITEALAAECTLGGGQYV